MGRRTPIERHVRIYRRLLFLYPPGFREEYGAAMTQLFADQLRDRRATPRRMWLRTASDLVLSAANERMEATMSQDRDDGWKRVGAPLAVLAAAAFAFIGVGVDDPGSALIAAGVALGLIGVFVGVAAGVRRALSRPTEAVWRLSPLRRNWWTPLAGLVAVFYLFAGVSQLLGEPTAGNVAALVPFLVFAGLVAVGLVLRVRRRGTLGAWLALVGVLPGVGVFWFPPVLIVSLIAAVGVLAEAMAGGTRPVPPQHQT